MLKCFLCGLAVARNNLARHLAMHVGELDVYAAEPHPPEKAQLRKHACPTCQRPFTKMAYYTKHVAQCRPAVLPAETPPPIVIIEVNPALL